jgi:hypothetical protein
MNRITLSFVLLATLAFGQIPANQPSRIPLSSQDVRVAEIPALTAVTYLDLVVDPSIPGGDAIDVVSSSEVVVVSLMLPSGTEVTPANGVSLGFTVLHEVVTQQLIEQTKRVGVFDQIGTHTTFLLPPSSPGGVYRVKANSTTEATVTGLRAGYISLHGVKVGVGMTSISVAPSEPAVITAYVFSGTTPVNNAVATATIIPPTDLNASSSIGNFQLISQTTQGGYTKYLHSADFTTSGPTRPLVVATPGALPSGVTLADAGTLGFANTVANGSTTSLSTFSVIAPAAQSFSPATLTWDIQATGTPVTITLPDTGTYNSGANDGLYAGAYTPTTVGTYQVLLDISGSYAGNNFSRTLSTSFRVAAPLATLASITNAGVDDDSNGLFERLALRANVTVQTAGKYRFSAVLSSTASKSQLVQRMVDLPVGGGVIEASAPYYMVRALGSDGPYTISGVSLIQVPANGPPVAVATLTNAGQTAAYLLSSFERAPISFTGPHSATGIVGAGPTFDKLRVTIGVYKSDYAGACSWSAVLADGTGVRIIDGRSSGELPLGASSITLDFDGNVIARAANGPYKVRNALITCDGQSARETELFQTQSFTASQFTSVAADFGLVLGAPPAAAAQGVTSRFPFSVTSVGGFDGEVFFTVSGLPAGATATFSTPAIIRAGPLSLRVTTGLTTPPGTHALTITATSGSLSHQLPITLNVLPPVATPTFSPSPISGASFTGVQNVTMSTATAGSTIYYTTDGTTPTTGSTQYTVPVTVARNMTLKALAVKTGLVNSVVKSGIYTIQNLAASVTVLTGTNAGGSVASLTSNDNNYYQVASATSGTPGDPHIAEWYASFAGVPAAPATLKVIYRGSNTATVTQTVSIWDWTTSAWLSLDSRSVGTVEALLPSLTPPGGLNVYVSGTGEVRVRIRVTQASTAVTSNGEVLTLSY